MKTVPELTPGDRVCVAGRGTDSLLHKHTTVERLTKTMIICADGRRFTRDLSGSSIPYSPYGGTSIAAYCQKKEKK